MDRANRYYIEEKCRQIWGADFIRLSEDPITGWITIFTAVRSTERERKLLREHMLVGVGFSVTRLRRAVALDITVNTD